MAIRRLAGLSLVSRATLLIALLSPGLACVGVDEELRALGWNQKPEEPIKLTDAEQMIDELDRIMTAYGTISVKTPDVWGQDRLAKFRSEYELQMAEWLKHGFKSDINAAVRRSEIESTQVQTGTSYNPPPSKNARARREFQPHDDVQEPRKHEPAPPGIEHAGRKGSTRPRADRGA